MQAARAHPLLQLVEVRRLATIATAVALLLGIAVDPAQAWRQSLSGSRFAVDDHAVATAIDARGDVIAVTVSIPDPGPCRLVVTKRDGSGGRLRWERSFDGCRALTRVALALAADGDVVVGLPGFVLVRLAGATGKVVWRNAPGPDVKWSWGYVNAIAVDAAGDVFAAGDGVFNPFDDEDHDFVVVKVRGATGDPVWHFSIDGELAPCPPDDYCEDDVYPYDWATALALDLDGRVFVSGGWDHYRDGGFIVVALDAAVGAELWRWVRPAGIGMAVVAAKDAVYAGGYDAGGALVARLDPATGRERWLRDLGSGWVPALALHRSGDPIVAGVVTRQGSSEPFAARLRSAQGQTVWHATLAKPSPGGRVEALSVVVGSGDLVGVLASAIEPQDPDVGPSTAMMTVLEARLGAERWHAPLSGTDGGQGRAWGLAFDARGDLVVAGGVRNVDTQYDAALARLRGGDGEAVWRLEENGRPAGDDWAGAVATDAAGDAFVVGTVTNAVRAGGADLFVAKLARGSGQVRWRREIDGGAQWYGASIDSGSDVAVAGDGAALVGGRIGDRVTVLALDGATGTERWRAALPAELGYESVFSLATDASGDVAGLVAGRGAAATAVLKLDGTSGAERWLRPVDLGVLLYAGTPAAAVLPDGTVVTASYGYDAAVTRTFVGLVVAFDAASGAERWRRVFVDAVARTIVADLRGRVVVGLGLSGNSLESDAAVAVLDPATGVELGRTLVTSPILRPAVPTALAVDPAGGVLVGGFAGQPGGAFVARVDADGALAWSRLISPIDHRLRGKHVAGVAGLAFLPRDGAVLGFTLFSEERQSDWALAGFSARTGGVRWVRTLDGDATAGPPAFQQDRDLLGDLAVSPQGELVAVGTMSSADAGDDLTVVGLRARNGRERGLSAMPLLDPPGRRSPRR